MKNALLLMLLSTVQPLCAQITVLATTFPAPNDVLRYVQAANPSAAIDLYTPPGGNQTWDLSMLTPTANFEQHYLPAAEGVYKNNFPTATMVLKNGTEENYYSTTATKFELLGQAATTVGGLPLLVVFQNAPLLAERSAPVNFFDIRQQSTGNTVGWAFSELPSGAVNLPFIPDSVRFRIAKQILEVCDGWGNLRLPGSLPQSEFPVLRIKQTAYKEQRIDAKVPPLGWLDITNAVIQSGSPWASLFGTDTVVTHHYYNDVSKEAIAVLTFNNEQNAVTSVVYKNTSGSSPVFEIGNEQPTHLQIAPNPAKSATTIRCANALSGTYTLKIFSSLGTLVVEHTYFLVENTPLPVLLPTGLSGLYYCRLEDSKGTVVGTGRLVVIQ